jgi:Flp pilus assembly protein TadG
MAQGTPFHSARTSLLGARGPIPDPGDEEGRFHPRPQRRRGFVVVALCFCIAFVVAAVGLSVDLGRLYVVRNEAQTFVDSAALEAALELDGTTAGIARATNRVVNNVNRWMWETATFTNPVAEYAAALAGPWEASPSPAAGYRFARVRADLSVPLQFLPSVVQDQFGQVVTSAVAAQIEKTKFTEGVFPFSPYAHNSTPPNFGLTPGQLYTFRWPSAPKMNNVCDGDKSQAVLNKQLAGPSEQRGFIDINMASIVKLTIETDYQSIPHELGEIVNRTNGSMQTGLDSIIARVNQDTNPNAPNYTSYNGSGTGNGRRLVLMPLNDGNHPTPRIVGFGSFLLPPDGQYDKSGNQSWCAEYIGPYVQGSSHSGASTEGSGAFVVRLVQ